MMYILRTDIDSPSLRNHKQWMLNQGLEPSKPIKLKPYSKEYLILDSDIGAFPALLSKNCFKPAPVLDKELDEYM